MKNTKLKYRRVQLGKTQAEVARHIGIAERAYQNYEAGLRLPNVVTAIHIARELQSTVEELFDVPTENE